MTGSEFATSRARLRFLPARIGVVSLRLAAVLAIIAAITFLCTRLIPVNATTGGFAYLLAILVIATRWGFLEALAASLLAVLCFNFFFLPPISAFTIGMWVSR